jgi:hypothetical protein
MPIKNEVLTQLGGPVADAPGLQINTGLYEQSIIELGEAAGAARTESLSNQLRTQLYNEEMAFDDELVRLTKERDQAERQADVLDDVGGAYAQAPEEVRSMMRALGREDMAGEQNLIDPNRLGVRKEKIFREFAAKYPRLIPEFLKVASSSGLGGHTDMQTQEMIDYLNDGAVAASAARKSAADAGAEYYKTLSTQSWSLNIRPAPPGASAAETAAWLTEFNRAAKQAAVHDYALKELGIHETGNKYDVEQSTKYVNNIFTYQGPAITKGLMGSLSRELAAHFNVTDIRQIPTTMNFESAEAARVRGRVAYENWKGKYREQFAAVAPQVMSNITPEAWASMFATTDKIAEDLFSTLGTDKFASYVENINKVYEGIWTHNVGPENILTLEMFELASRNGNAIGADLYQSTIPPILGRGAAAAQFGASAPVTQALAIGAQAGGVPVGKPVEERLITPQGLANPQSTLNVGEIAASSEELAKSGGKVDFVNNYIANQQLALAVVPGPGLTPENANKIRQGALAQITGTLAYLERQAVGESSRTGKPYLPDDSTLAILVETLAMPQVTAEVDKLPANTKEYIRRTSGLMLQYELAYIATRAAEDFSQDLASNRSVTNITMFSGGSNPGAEGGLFSLFSGKSLETSSGLISPNAGELFEMHVDNEGIVSIRVRPSAAAVMSPGERTGAASTVLAFDNTHGVRMTNAIRAMKNIGAISAYSDAIDVMRSIEGFPPHLLPEDVETAPGPTSRRGPAKASSSATPASGEAAMLDAARDNAIEEANKER